MKQLDHKTLLENVYYDHETGDFTRRKATSHMKVGDKAGYIDPRGYVKVDICGKKLYAHRVAWAYMTGSWPESLIDHINGDKSDNRFSNLRQATHSQNNANRKMTNPYGFKGVGLTKSKYKLTKPWNAQLEHNGKHYNLGAFRTAEDAHEAYREKALELHKDFSKF